MKVNYKAKYNRYILSIGLIVKNEEKNLPRCLEALKPLMEAVPSELIIVDTGSEDRTVEIAKEYTENVYFYEWNKDFAAARNYGLSRASGQWFMYLDADEQLTDPEELISFFNTSGACAQYNTAEITVRSFLDKELTQYSDFTASRIFRMSTGNRFYGIIHEVPRRIHPIKVLESSRLDHYGYIYETEADRERKFHRNNELLKIELEKEPDNPRLICLYSASCPDEERRDLLEHGRNLVRDKPDDYYYPEMYWRLSRVLLREKEYERLLEIGEEYKANTTSDHVGEIELEFNMGFAYFQKSQYEETVTANQRYLDLYKRYKEGSLIRQDTASNVCERVSAKNYNTVLLQLISSYVNLEQYEEAFESLMKVDLNEVDPSSDQSILIGLAKMICTSKHFEWLVKADEWITKLQLPEPRERPYIVNIVNFYLQSTVWEEGTHKPEKGNSLLSEIILLEDNKDWENLLCRLAENQTEAENYGVAAMYRGICSRRDLYTLLQNTKIETIQKWNIRLAKQVKNLGELLIEYRLNEKEKDNMLLRFWLADLETRVANSCGEEYKLFMAHRITEDLSWYVNHLYNENILTPDGICVLPSAQRFAYWCGKALEAKELGDTLNYIKVLGEASRACPEMAEVSKLLIQEVRDNDEALKAKREQQELAKKIKGIVEGMILAGNKEDAQSILAQYELIAPNDPDIVSLKGAIMQQLVISEVY